jgi:ComF family protein
MLDNFLTFVAPHYCCGCGKIGSLLCDNCEYYIKSEQKMLCIACRKPTGRMWLCDTCRVPYERAWAVGERDGVLQRLIGLYKFERTQSAYKILGNLLLNTLPELPENTIIVPVPTVSSHVRERGYDHMLLIAKHIAKARGLKCEQKLYRRSDTKQRQSTSTQRVAQAKLAFAVSSKIDDTRPYLLVDDVATTGATIKYASKTLRDAGAKHVWVAVIARQTLD